jgi:CDP-diacylglycerol---serine O-phosphatidyltransferase
MTTGSSHKPTAPTKRRRLRLNLGRAMFVLPNLFTLSSVFCGLYAIALISGTPGPKELSGACLAVFFSAFFDMADGRVARMTRTQSDFGMQLDSLADAVAFGVAPAMIVYKWGLISLGMAGLATAFIYLGCGLIRLARFNVLAAHEEGTSSYFTGVPIPLAAGMLCSVVMYHQQTLAEPAIKLTFVIGMTVALGILMVSNVRYRNFKNVKATATSMSILGALLTGFIGLAIGVKASFAFMIYFSGYILFGLIEEVIRLKRKVTARPAHPECDVLEEIEDDGFETTFSGEDSH